MEQFTQFGISRLLPVQVDLDETGACYTIAYRRTDGGRYTTQLVRKRWGMYMLGAVDFTTPGGEPVRLVGASTDFEWVFRCGRTPGTVTFRGGNHGDYTDPNWRADNSACSNERLLDMTFFDASSGEVLSLLPGGSARVNGLRVVMHSCLYQDEFLPEHVLIEAEKDYLFNGEDVCLRTRFRLLQDVWFGRSCSCMMPIFKRCGNFARFYNDDGTTKLVRTPLHGSSQYGNNFSNGNVASKAELWGEGRPDCHMTVSILHPEDQFFRSDLYTRFWDMNPVANKLYFSCFRTEPSPVGAGTEWDYRSRWQFSYCPTFTCSEEADELVGF